MTWTRTLAIAAASLAIGSGFAATFACLDLSRQIQGLSSRVEAAEAQLTIAAGEITRFRIEQSAEGRGPLALLERLRTFAPLLSSAQTPQPDYQAARKEMEAVLRAFASLGEDAWSPTHQRFLTLEPKQGFDELHWLLRALARCSQERGTRLVREVLAGTQKPSPRLRWSAAELLTEIDKDAARTDLRRILLSETSRGVDPDRAMAHGVQVLDPMAVATSGFSNFLVWYMRTDDPATEDTVLQVLMRTNQDVVTLQEAVKVLGERRTALAAERIEALYRNPPGAQQNPLFLNHCLDALASIRGKALVPFLETELTQAQHELVQNHIKHVLQELK